MARVEAKRFPLLTMVFQGTRGEGRLPMPSIYTFGAKFEEMLALGVLDEGLAGPDVTLASIDRAVRAPDAEALPSEPERSEVGEIPMPRAGVIHVGGDELVPKDVLAFPGQKGLVDLMVELAANLSPEDRDRLREALAGRVKKPAVS